MRGAALSVASLGRADLRGADLSGANLWHATLGAPPGVTPYEQLSQAFSLQGATMPDGQKYEDWLKDKKAQGKDEKNE
jgi:uncharacterized protein YjbI with pentapeptide repeats